MYASEVTPEIFLDADVRFVMGRLLAAAIAPDVGDELARSFFLQTAAGFGGARFQVAAFDSDLLAAFTPAQPLRETLSTR